MKIRLIIRTPPGNAKTAEEKIKKVILPWKKIKSFQSHTSPEDDTIIWEIEDDYKTINRILKNTSKFDKMMQLLLQNKMFKKHLQKNYEEEDINKLEEMLLQHTSIEIIKAADVNEFLEGNKPLWQKIRDKFKSKKEEEK